MMATGIGSGGGYRLTAARRFSLVGLAFVVAAVVALAGPSAVWAVDSWSREVDMDPSFEPVDIFAFDSQFVVPSGPGGTCGHEWRATPFDVEDAPSSSMGGWTFYDHTSNSHNGCYRSGGTSGARAMHFGWHTNTAYNSYQTGTIAGGFANAGPVTVVVVWSGVSVGSCSLQVFARDAYLGSNVQTYVLDDAGSGMGDPSSGSWTHEFTGDDWNHIVVQPSSCAYTGFDVVFQTESAAAGSCAGQGELSWPASGLTTGSNHSAWGDVYHTDPAGCEFTRRGLFHYKPPEGWFKGETHLLSAQISGSEDRAGRITIQWSCGFTTSGYQLEVDALPGEQEAALTLTDVPPVGLGMSGCFRIQMEEGTILHHLRLANVEHTEEDDDADAIDRKLKGSGGGAWEDCVPGSGVFDVEGWLEYLGCLLLGIPVAVAQAFTALLTTLFVPGPTLGSRMEALVTSFGNKVPFGWFNQIVASIQASAAAGAGSLSAFNLTVGTATVSIGAGIDDALAGVSPYRGLIFAGVALVMGLGCLRWVMAAVGVSPGGGGAASADGSGSS